MKTWQFLPGTSSPWNLPCSYHCFSFMMVIENHQASLSPTSLPFTKVNNLTLLYIFDFGPLIVPIFTLSCFCVSLLNVISSCKTLFTASLTCGLGFWWWWLLLKFHTPTPPLYKRNWKSLTWRAMQKTHCAYQLHLTLNLAMQKTKTWALIWSRKFQVFFLHLK